jgi:hypothetical protein
MGAAADEEEGAGADLGAVSSSANARSRDAARSSVPNALTFDIMCEKGLVQDGEVADDTLLPSDSPGT